jgi:hypothetical protein
MSAAANNNTLPYPTPYPDLDIITLLLQLKQVPTAAAAFIAFRIKP